jgi:hypothetical protein
VLNVRKADRGSVVLAPALEPAQAHPEGKKVLEVLSTWLGQSASSAQEPL